MARVRELEAIGEKYRAANKNFLPDRVRWSGKAQRFKARKALGDGDGWLSRLAMAGNNLKFYTISLEALGLKHLEYEANLYNHAAVNKIKDAILNATSGVFWARLEVGDRERKLHVHVLAYEAPTVTHNAKTVFDLGGMAIYISKCPVPSDNLSAGIFLEAKYQAQLKGRRLPKTSFSRGIPKSKNHIR
jgi:hypothetical protein